MPFIYIRRAAVALAFFATVSCTIKNTATPDLTGPSGLTRLLTVTASPGSINQNGSDYSTITITALKEGKPDSGVAIRVDTKVNGVAVDFGTLTNRSLVTDSAGVATVMFIAPPAPPNGIFTPCASSDLPGSCVTVVATETGTNFGTANSGSVLVRLMPTGVISPPPTATPVPVFSFDPTNPTVNSLVQFNASASCGGPPNPTDKSCSTSAPSITAYSWNFGDGQIATGPTVSHSFGLQPTYGVTLTVTNALGASASTTQIIKMTLPDLPKPNFTSSPSIIHVNDTVFFNASASTAGTGRTIRSYDWDFGDGTAHGSGVAPTHVYAKADPAYTITLIVTDDLGQQGVDNTKKVAVLP